MQDLNVLHGLTTMADLNIALPLFYVKWEQETGFLAWMRSEWDDGGKWLGWTMPFTGVGFPKTNNGLEAATTN